MANFCLTHEWVMNDEEVGQITAIIEIAKLYGCHLYGEGQINSDGYFVETFIVSASSQANLENFIRDAKAQTIFSNWVENKVISCPDSGPSLEALPPYFRNPVFDAWIAHGRINKQHPY